MRVLSRDEFKSASEMSPVPVPLPECGEDAGYYVGMMSGRERGEIERQFSGSKPTDDPSGFRVAVLVRSVCDAQGKRLFTAADAAWLAERAAGALERLFEAACKLNGYSKADVEDLEKNSESGRRNVSSSGSVLVVLEDAAIPTNSATA